MKLGIPDLLADGPRTAEDLAGACGADLPALRRLLRALALLGLFSQPTPTTFGLTATTELLRSDVPGSVRLHALMQGEEIYQSFGEIMHTLHTGRPSFEKVYGQAFYDYLPTTRPRRTPSTSRWVRSRPRPRSPPATCAATRSSSTSAAAVELCWPTCCGPTRPPGVCCSTWARRPQLARTRFRDEGLAERAECVDGSFFTEVPGGGDVYLLSRVLHNWADHNALEILRVAYAAMRPPHRLLVCSRTSCPTDAAPSGRSARRDGRPADAR